MNIKNLLCRHNVVHVKRWHPDVLEPEMKKKVLYVDDLGVCNIVQCSKCGKFLKGRQNQSEKLRSQKDN